MLHKFLTAEREPILALCLHTLAHSGEHKPGADKIDRGLPIFFDELVGVLQDDEDQENDPSVQVSDSIHRTSAERCGLESMRDGFTISQVVHGYGALCQAITKHAGDRGEQIHPREFNRLNFCLDIAIAEAVTEYSRVQKEADSGDEILRLGFLAHEMRNALDNAAIAHSMMKKGIVGLKGSTNQVLENALTRMGAIIDRSLTEVRMHGEPILELHTYRLSHLIDRIETMAAFEADAKSITLVSDVPTELYVEVDQHLLISAISNLVQNAIKFTKKNGKVTIRAKVINDRVLIEVEDQCGGLPPGKIDELFVPFTQKAEDKQGVGLGLTISRRAVALNGGKISASDKPHIGCVFIIDLPLAKALEAGSSEAVESIH